MERVICNLRKSGVFILLCFCLCFSANAVPSGKYSLLVNLKDGTQQIFMLKEKPSVIFENNRFVITQSGSNVEFSFDNVLNFSFSDSTTGIKAVTDKNLAISYTDSDHLLVHGANSNTKVRITKLDGKLVSCQITKLKDNTLLISLENLQTGIYVVSIDNKQNFKIIKK